MNIPNLVTTFNHIIDNLDEYDQYHYHDNTDCGTVHCFAGHAQILAGKLLSFDDVESAYYDAAEWLELSEDDADWLFSCLRKLHEIHCFITIAAEGEDGPEWHDRYAIYPFTEQPLTKIELPTPTRESL